MHQLCQSGVIHGVIQDYTFGWDQTTPFYGDFEGFPENNSALFGLVI